MNRRLWMEKQNLFATSIKSTSNSNCWITSHGGLLHMEDGRWTSQPCESASWCCASWCCASGNHWTSVYANNWWHSSSAHMWIMHYLVLHTLAIRKGQGCIISFSRSFWHPLLCCFQLQWRGENCHRVTNEDLLTICRTVASQQLGKSCRSICVDWRPPWHRASYESALA